jgi:molybdopterin molybdotransferase
VRDFGVEKVSFENALGRVLAESIKADRDFPPFDRVSMDGIAIRFSGYENGIRTFAIEKCVGAGKDSGSLNANTGCIEIMTGAPLPKGADTVIRYEDLLIENDSATIINEVIKTGQNIHQKATDASAGDILAKEGTLIDASVFSICASVGAMEVVVKKLPRIAVISTGDELVEINNDPLPWQIRRSNVYLISGKLQECGIRAYTFHVRDNDDETKRIISDCLVQFDVVLLSGGVSMGKFDSIPAILQSNGVTCLFHKLKQRPGKPFWFGENKTTTVFAFPGNPVSTSLCLHRYFLPWLKQCLQLETTNITAILQDDVEFLPDLQYFLQVKLEYSDGMISAIPLAGKGSGDQVNLLQTDAFMELPAPGKVFSRGGVFRVWPFKNIF